MPGGPASDTVLAQRLGGVLLLTLNRPDRLNAWTAELQARYFELLDEAESDPDVRAIVVTGAGRGFCAGADMEYLGDVMAGEIDGLEPRPRTHPLTIRKPLIAAINGSVAGLGLIEALYCDLRFCTPDAKITTALARRGLVAEYGLSWLLPRVVGVANALDLLLSARVVSGVEALSMGLVNRLVPRESIVEEAVAYAQDLATFCSPASMATIKSQIFEDLDRSLDDAIAGADELMLRSFELPDMREGVDSFLEKRPPDFAGLPAKS